MSYDRAAAMMSYVGLYYQRSRIYRAQNEAKASEYNALRSMIDEVADQFFVETASWGINLWEKYCGFEPNDGEDIEVRRKRVTSWLQIVSPITPLRLKHICETIVNNPVIIVPVNSPYTFQVKFLYVPSCTKKSLYDTIDNAKPAHLSFRYVETVKTIGILDPIAYTRSGLRLTVLPYVAEKQYAAAQMKQAAVEKIGIRMTIQGES